MTRKACRYCGSSEHTNFYCRMRKRQPIKVNKRMNPKGKIFKQWMTTRQTWFRKFPAEYYYCYLCGKRMLPSETTLDHVIPRSKAPELRFKLDNLKPCCWKCNDEKGSKVYND